MQLQIKAALCITLISCLCHFTFEQQTTQRQQVNLQQQSPGLRQGIRPKVPEVTAVSRVLLKANESTLLQVPGSNANDAIRSAEQIIYVSPYTTPYSSRTIYTTTYGAPYSTPYGYGTPYGASVSPTGLYLSVNVYGQVVDQYGRVRTDFYVSATGQLYNAANQPVNIYGQVEASLTIGFQSGNLGYGGNTNPDYSLYCCYQCDSITNQTQSQRCYSQCQRVCIRSSTCRAAGQGAYSAYCSSVCGATFATDVTPPLSTLRQCIGQCSADIQTRCQRRCNDLFSGCNANINDCLIEAARNCQSAAD